MVRKGAAKISRNKKRYWRKGTYIGDIEEHLNDQNRAEIIGSHSNSQLFSLDYKKAESKFTKRQHQAILKLEEYAKNSQVNDIKPKKTKEEAVERKRMNITKSPVKIGDSKSEIYDIWADPVIKLSDHDYYLRQNVKKLPQEPKTIKHCISLLPKVEIPHPGMSYNPTYKDHQHLLAATLKDELKFEKSEKKLDNKLNLIQGEEFVTNQDILNEKLSGLNDDPDIKDEPLDDFDECYKSEKGPINSANRKLTAIRRRQMLRSKELFVKKKEKQKIRMESDVFRVKKLKKEIETKQDKIEKNSKLRAIRKKTQKLTTTNCLGKGKFEKIEEPFLLTQELVSSLRETEAQGDLLMDRFKSLQKRNILPISGEKMKSKTKRKLKIKYAEQRAHKEVTIGMKLI